MVYTHHDHLPILLAEDEVLMQVNPAYEAIRDFTRHVKYTWNSTGCCTFVGNLIMHEDVDELAHIM